MGAVLLPLAQGIWQNHQKRTVGFGKDAAGVLLFWTLQGSFGLTCPVGYAKISGRVRKA